MLAVFASSGPERSWTLAGACAAVLVCVPAHARLRKTAVDPSPTAADVPVSKPTVLWFLKQGDRPAHLTEKDVARAFDKWEFTSPHLDIHLRSNARGKIEVIVE